ncbi:MAG: DNA repair protein RadA [Caldisericaceae bacterium]
MKKKTSSSFVCSVCGYKSPIKLGKCPNCGSWNSFINVEEEVETSGEESLMRLDSETVRVTEDRMKTGIEEFDRVLGGGIVEGSIVLVSGEPGIGKSTLLLQVAGAIAENVGKVLYVSGEESYFQIRMRAERLGIKNSNILILTEQDAHRIKSFIASEQPKLVIIDSIQTMNTQDVDGNAGAITQVRECTRVFTEIAKKTGTPIILVGHVTKEGTIAGPKAIEHIVDGVFYIEGSRNDVLRLLRSVKNRFGTTNEAGMFEMRESGLVGVSDPTLEFISENGELPVGSAITASLEGTLPVFFEVQSLVTPTVFPLPRRVAAGVEYNRILLLVAVIEKRLRLKLGSFDVYVNTIGGFRTEDRSMDLALCMAIISSYLDKKIPEKTVIMGEPGLGGELRPTIGIERKIKHGLRLGFENFLVPSFLEGKIDIKSANVMFARDIEEAKSLLF